jgi:DNA-binding SARP family transcriptional activator
VRKSTNCIVDLRAKLAMANSAHTNHSSMSVARRHRRLHASPAILVRLLGPPEWQAGKVGVTRFTAKDAVLVAKLALEGPQARAELCDLLWPDSPPQKGYANLRSRASRLNLAAGVRFIEIDENIRLSEDVSIDLLQMDRMDVPTLLGAGVLLSGVDVSGHDGLDRWVADARTRVAGSFADVLDERAAALEREGRLQDALAIARKAVEWLPLSESGWYRLMQLHYLRNDRAAAQETFWRCSALLRDELGIRPGAPMLELMQTVEAVERVPVSRHRQVPASVLRPPTLIGRDQVWQTMWSAWQHHQPFLLVGDAGMGKSRLIEEFCRGQAGIVIERATPGDERAPYALLGRLLVEIEHRFASGVGPQDRAELARLRPEFGPAPAAPGHAALLENALEHMLVGALHSGLQAVMLDDLHNADAATLDVLRRLTARRALGTLQLGLASRPTGEREVLAALAAWAEDSRRLVRVDLPALTALEVSELLASLMVPSLIDPAFVERIYKHAGGHPLYTLATLHAALVGGADPLSGQLPRPGSIQALLDARIAGLPSGTEDLLRVAAVAGPDLSADRAARMLDCPVLALAAPWADLEAADILRGETFSHDLVHEAALRTVPQGVRQGLHRQFALVLGEDPSVNPARLAAHWERGERMLEAGRCWHDAAKSARGAALLAEQNDLFLRAARCYEAAGERAARFDALSARLEGMQLRPGGAAVLDALPEVESLAEAGWQYLRCRLARAEALLGVERPREAAEVAAAAVSEAGRHPNLRADAQALHAQALVQCGHFDAAVDSATRALDSAAASGDAWQKLRVLQALSFVHYAMGQIPESLAWQRQSVEWAESIGHRFESAAGEGHIAVLLAIIGDVAGTYEQAKRARARHRLVGIDRDGTLGSVNDRVLGSASAALGRFDEALEALQEGVQSAGPQAAPGAKAKAQLALAGLWLTLGRAGLAREALADLHPDQEPSRQMQLQLLLAQIAECEGASAQRFMATLAKIGADHADLPLMRSAWFEWSYQGKPSEVVDRLQGIRLQCETLGLQGAARGLQWRELVRWLEIPGPAATAAALDHARALERHVNAGMGAKCHPPQVWYTLSQAYGRAGDDVRQAECLQSARQWLEEALHTVPLEYRHSFVHGNPLHERLLRAAQP